MEEFHTIEGDYLKTKNEKLIFDVKGLYHPNDRKICFIRFFPSPEGDRIKKGIKYKKIYDLYERYIFLKKNYPKYLFYSKQFDMELQGVKNEDIYKIYTPRNYFKELKNKKNKDISVNYALSLCELFIEKGKVPENSIGISGSQMVGLNKENSDIDLIIYGTQICIDFQKRITNIFRESTYCRNYTLNELKTHYKWRAGGSGISFVDFLKYEKRKLHQGKFHNFDFFIRYIKSPEDCKKKYYDYKYENCGRIKLKARITDADDSIYTPCKYKIEVIKILDKNHLSKEISTNRIQEITSFRGRFCEHAYKEELVIVEGKLEKVVTKEEEFYYRIVLGNKKTDKMLIN
ncbi:MAG: hypothetical protein KGD57_09480 [Candidatus Lokiarchaeota archaeon]|nr:hypothetical protein [Candidatus Lokiarchaeota archaeon]